MRTFAVPIAVFGLSALVYTACLGTRFLEPQGEGHYVHLANSILHGSLEVLGNQPKGRDDWACFDRSKKAVCNKESRTHKGAEHWYVSFPVLPAVILLPFVAAFGTSIPTGLIWALFAAFGPLTILLLLEELRTTGASARSKKDNLLLTSFFAFGTVYFFCSVQGTVWYAAHIVSLPLTSLYLLFTVKKRPMIAGLFLGLSFLSRPTTLLLGVFSVLISLKTHPTWTKRFRELALFAVPIFCCLATAMWMNFARFEDPLEFGHSFLQIKWLARIEKWGLFHYHYIGRNLAVMLASLPWLSNVSPYITISRHGLALWVTSPFLLWLLWPKTWNPLMRALLMSAGFVALVDLAYQNSGWVQFGYRFSLDYTAPLIALLALGNRPLGRAFQGVGALAIAINLFGALTFNRAPQFYDRDRTQEVLFQPH